MLAFEPDGIDDFRSGRVLEINRFTGGAEREAHVRLVIDDKTASRDGDVRNDEAIGGWIIGQDASREVHCLCAVVVEFDVIDLGIVGVRQELVDHDRTIGICRRSLARAGGSSCDIAGFPCFNVAFAVSWTSQHERVARAVAGDGPRRIARVIRLQQDGAGLVAKLDCAGAV